MAQGTACNVEAVRGWVRLTLLAAGFGLGSCGKQDAAGPLTTYKGPLMETANVETLVSDSARLQFRLNSPLEQQFENGDILYPKGVTVTFYDRPGRMIVNTLQANYGKFDKNKQLYIMRGDVRVANVPKAQKMNTEELFYDKAKKLIYTDTAMFVRVETPTEVLTGHGLTANQDFSRYRILEPKGVFTLEQARAQGQ